MTVYVCEKALGSLPDAFFLRMSQMPTHHIRTMEIIRQLIQLQRRINLAGGVSVFSLLHIKFLRLERLVVEAFGLPDNNYYRQHIHVYPYSTTRLNTHIVEETNAWNWGNSSYFGGCSFEGELAIGYPNDNTGFGSTYKQADFIYHRMLKLAFEYHTQKKRK